MSSEIFRGTPLTELREDLAHLGLVNYPYDERNPSDMEFLGIMLAGASGRIGDTAIRMPKGFTPTTLLGSMIAQWHIDSVESRSIPKFQESTIGVCQKSEPLFATSLEEEIQPLIITNFGIPVAIAKIRGEKTILGLDHDPSRGIFAGAIHRHPVIKNIIMSGLARNTTNTLELSESELDEPFTPARLSTFLVAASDTAGLPDARQHWQLSNGAVSHDRSLGDLSAQCDIALSTNRPMQKIRSRDYA